MPSPVFPMIETLEQRIAPASLTFTSSTNENEKVTISSAKASVADLRAAVVSDQITGDQFTGSQVTFSLDLTNSAHFRGADLSVTASGSSDLFYLHEIDASGLNLTTVKVQGGDLGRIEAGTNSSSVPAIRTLQLSTLGHTEQLHSTVSGAVGSLLVSGTIEGTLELTGRYGSLSTGNVGGGLLGSAADETGSIIVSGKIGALTVTGNLTGGAGQRSGAITAGGGIGFVSTGSILGGAGQLSGEISAGRDIGAVVVNGSVTGHAGANDGASNGRVAAGYHLFYAHLTGSLTGGSAENSGDLVSGLGTGTVTIDGSITGGSGQQSGSVGSKGPLGQITIGTVSNTAPADVLTGGSGSQSGSLLSSGYIVSVVVNGNLLGGSGVNSGNIAAAGRLLGATVHGSVTGGTGTGSGAIGSTGPVYAVLIDGDLIGGGESAGQIVSATALGVIYVGGKVQGGTGTESGAIGSTGNIVSVTVHGDLIGGSADRSGSILSGNSIARVTIDHDVRGEEGEESGSISALGRIGSVTIHGNLDGTGGSFNSGDILSQTALGTIVIDGSVIGGGSTYSGTIYCTGPIASVSVGGNLDGTGNLSEGSGYFAGGILTQRPTSGEGSFPVPVNPLGYNIGTVSIQGALLGGDAFGTGSIFSDGSIGSVTISPEVKPFPAGGPGTPAPTGLHGGNEDYSASIFAEFNVASVTVHGSVGGGAGRNSGSIQTSAGRLSSVVIDEDLVGGSGSGSASLQAYAIGNVHIGGDVTGTGVLAAGSIIALGTDIASVTIGGTLHTQVDASNTGSTEPVRIAAQRNIGSVSVESIEGTSANRVSISAGGNASARNATEALAIGSVRVTEDMMYTDILAGYSTGLNSSSTAPGSQPLHGHVSVGLVEVGIDEEVEQPWVANNVKAGVQGVALEASDISTGNGAINAAIGKILIHGILGGQARGYGLLADEVRSVVIADFTLPLKAGAHNDYQSIPSGSDPGFTTSVYEVGAPVGGL